MDVDLSTPLLKENDRWEFEYSGVKRMIDVYLSTQMLADMDFVSLGADMDFCFHGGRIWILFPWGQNWMDANPRFLRILENY
jgi:hypothetical protein